MLTKKSIKKSLKDVDKMQKFNVIIIGGGASGVMTALTCGGKNKSVAIIDAGSFVGKKLLSTGNGKCNLSNNNMNSSFFNQNIDIFLKQFNEKDTINFFEKIGLVTKVDDCGRVYPFSNVAKSVVDVIKSKLNEMGIVQLTGQKVIDLEKSDDEFVVTTEFENETKKYMANKVVLASGGNTLDDILKKLNIKQTLKSPSLVSLKTKENTKHMSGVRVSDVKIWATKDNVSSTVAKEEFGEILFKDNGLSGIAVLNLSTYFARRHNFSGKVFIDFSPKIIEKSLIEFLKSRKILSGNLLSGFLNDIIAKEIYQRLKLDYKQENTSLTDTNICDIASLIKNLDFTVCGPYDNNQIYSGGVSFLELSERLEIKNIPNLFVCGELCDVDGETGGYNLQWAWTSGHIVGENL